MLGYDSKAKKKKIGSDNCIVRMKNNEIFLDVILISTFWNTQNLLFPSPRNEHGYFLPKEQIPQTKWAKWTLGVQEWPKMYITLTNII